MAALIASAARSMGKAATTPSFRYLLMAPPWRSTASPTWSKNQAIVGSQLTSPVRVFRVTASVRVTCMTTFCVHIGFVNCSRKDSIFHTISSDDSSRALCPV